jgi:hypothetical protein
VEKDVVEDVVLVVADVEGADAGVVITEDEALLQLS